jgi:sulfoxide reductase heme-binding subunit YedZ
VWLDQQLDWSKIAADIVKRPYVTLGFTAWLLLVPLAATSTRGMMRRLGRRWQRLHRLVYVAGVLGVLHFIWLVKADLLQPLIYASLLLILLAVRWRPHLLGRVAWSGRTINAR